MRNRNDHDRRLDPAAAEVSPQAPATAEPAAPRGSDPASLAVPWGLRETLWGIGLTVLPLGLLLLSAQLLPQQTTSSASAPLPPGMDASSAITVFVASTIVEAAFLIAPLYFALRARPPGTPRTEALRLLGLRRTALWRSVGLVVAGYVAIYLFGVLYDQLHIPTNADALTKQMAHAPITTIATLLVSVIVAPLTEELFFRGFVLPGFARAMPIWAAILLSSLIFGAAHADPGSFLPLFAIGLALSVIRWRTGSTWPSIALHAINNGAATIIILATTLHH